VAEQAISHKSEWSKGWARKAASLEALGQTADALLAAQRALNLEQGNAEYRAFALSLHAKVAQDAAQRERAPCEPPSGAPAARRSPGLCAFLRHDPPQGRGQNLLVLLHGLGDTAEKYLKLGERLQLPDTSVVAIEGTRPLGHGLGVEGLQGEGGGELGGYQWYPAFEANGDLISPDAADERRVRGLKESADAVQRTLEELWRQEGWCARGTLLFGFSQVDSVMHYNSFPMFLHITHSFSNFEETEHISSDFNCRVYYLLKN